ncbi:hypothetical protein JW992_14855 [candidate division KSB1 bacterium]|nr:hypothetical protein [candidate division KSB1 bacterium]
MGLDVNGTQCILFAKTLGVDFTQTATIGRQRLHLSPADLKYNLQKFGFSVDGNQVERIFSQDKGYAEALFRYLGARDVNSFDHSNYEQATHQHDFNKPIPNRCQKLYSLVCDSGSIEHVFNFPVAIKNCMEMVRMGGHYLGITPANNFMGHGFYQFSPELFYRVFSIDNGFRLLRLIAYEDTPMTKWYAVQNPASINTRVTLTNDRPVYLVVIAERIANLTPFQSAPQQSDYLSVWNSYQNSVEKNPNGGSNKKSRVLTTAIAMTPQPVKRFAKHLLRINQSRSGFNPKFFQRIELTDIKVSHQTRD